MNKLIFLPIVALAFSSLANAKSIEREINIEPDAFIGMSTQSGEIEVITWDKPMLQISGEIQDDTDFEVDENGDTVEITVRGKKSVWGSNGGNAELVIKVPKQARLELRGFSTSFDIKDIANAIDVSTMSGDLRLANSSGKLSLKSVSGDIRADDVSGKLKIGSVSGDLDISGSIDELIANTVSGDIQAVVETIANLELVTVSGEVDAAFNLTDNGLLQAHSVSGDIDLEFGNEPVNARFDINTGPGGNVRNKLSDDKPERDSYAISNKLEFWLGKGDAQVELRTMSGTIELDK